MVLEFKIDQILKENENDIYFINNQIGEKESVICL